MTGTACELIEYDEFENNCLNKFDLFSLCLFEKINNDCMQIDGSADFESALKGYESTRSDLVIIDGGINVVEAL